MNQIYRDKFIQNIKPLFKTYKQSQIDGIHYLLDFLCPENIITPLDKRQIAYIFATVLHETGATMQPIEEYGKGKGKPYGLPSENGKIHYGRGYVQLTLGHNYKKVGDILGLDLYNNPDLVMAGEISATILIRGMMEGWFTGKKLSDYFNEKTDWINARRVINGTDKTDTITTYAQFIYKQL